MLMMREYKTTAFKKLALAHSGQSARLEIATTEGDIGILFPAAALAPLVPVFAQAEAQVREKLTGKADARVVFDVTDVRVGLSAEKSGIVISVTLPQGHAGGMGFRIDVETARRLSNALAALAARSGPKTVQ